MTSGHYLRTAVLITLFALLILAMLTLFSGCNGIRFAPTASQQQSAELTHQLATIVNLHGTDPASPASQKLLAGTSASLAYIGRPAVAPDLKAYDTITTAAHTDAQKRPTINDVLAETDGWLYVAGQLAILFGFGSAAIGGKKTLDWITLAKQKNKALSEIISGNELLKKTLEDDALKIFGKSQNAIQSKATRKIVAAERIGTKQPQVS